MSGCVIVAPARRLGPDGDMCVVLQELLESVEHQDSRIETSVAVFWEEWANLWIRIMTKGVPPRLEWVREDGVERGTTVPNDRDTRKLLLPEEFGIRLFKAIELGGCRAELKEHRHLFGDPGYDSNVIRRNGTSFIM